MPSAKQAASAQDSSRGLGTTLAAGTTTMSANVPWNFSLSSERAGSRVSSGPPPMTSAPPPRDPAGRCPRHRSRGSSGRHRPRCPPAQRPRSWWLMLAARTRTAIHPAPAPAPAAPRRRAPTVGRAARPRGVDGEHDLQRDAGDAVGGRRSRDRSSNRDRDAAVERRRHDVVRRHPVPTTAAIASAAARCMLGVILRACTSSAPRKSPGKASTLLIWLGSPTGQWPRPPHTCGRLQG